MTKYICIVLAVLLTLLSVDCLAESIPDSSTIIEWAGLTKEDTVEKVAPILLKNGEQAYIAQISRDRGRNDMYGAYLVRPKLKQAKEIMSSVHELEIVPGTSNPTLVTIEVGASGQGDEYNRKSILYFKEWESIVIHKVSYGSSDVCVNSPYLRKPCYNRDVKWDFSSTNNNIQLIETILYVKWQREPKAGKVPGTKTVNVYSIHGLSFSLRSTKKKKVEIDTHN